MINSLDFEKIRSECKVMIENLEIWIRNIIDKELTDKYGATFWEYENDIGNRLISKGFIREAKERYENEPERYPRFVDSLLLDDIIKIICKPDLYVSVFKQYLFNAFPDGNDVTRTFLNRLIPIRNKLYHSNPISYHEALQAMCYSNDIIASIKLCYIEKNMEKKYNAPTIIKISDSFGNQYNESQIKRNNTGRGHCDTRSKDLKVNVGDKIVIEVEIDPSFEPDDYTVDWVFDKKNQSKFTENKNKIEITVENKHVRTDFAIYCSVTSIKDWHRCGNVDDCVSLLYEIIPNE
ncbi:hypothetical protein JYT89_02545 [Flavobacteriaceae bacterium AH-315-B10]|nr:hypothetical protein [Flavobacteriaceae bacterium AH-315-B10]